MSSSHLYFNFFFIWKYEFKYYYKVHIYLLYFYSKIKFVISSLYERIALIFRRRITLIYLKKTYIGTKFICILMLLCIIFVIKKRIYIRMVLKSIFNGLYSKKLRRPLITVKNDPPWSKD